MGNNKKLNFQREMNRKNRMVAFTLSVLSLFVLIGIGYAYFSAPVSNTNKEKFSI